MFHAAKLVAGQDGHPIFLEGLADAGVGLEPPQREGYLVEHGFQLGHLFRVAFPVEGREGAPVALGCLGLEASGGEGKEIGGQQVGGAECESLSAVAKRFPLRDVGIAEGGPFLGQCEGKGETGLQVGLVETGKDRAGMVGHEECVEIVSIAVQSLVSAHNVDIHMVVLALFEPLAAHHDMLVMVLDRPLFPVHGDMVPVYRPLEVYLQVFVAAAPHESHPGLPPYRFLFLCGQVKVQGVGHIAYL